VPVAVVTGGNSGIGAALARELAACGWQCVLIARNEERLRSVASAVGGEYEVCDVGDRDAVERTAAAVIQRHPAVKLLVNNAGFALPRDEQRGRDFPSADPEQLEELFRVNVLGAVWCLRAFLPALQAARPAHVVNVASVAGTVATPPGPYSATKHALVAFSRALAAGPPEGVRIHTVNPGLVETPGFPQRGRLRSRLLVRAVVEPEYVARRIVRAVERDRPEIFVPGWYRVAAVAQATAPGLVSRVLSRRARQRSR
jgi:NAD(P)-dependent dehydrogenase (short-subunit alcohol dehydrogenase family)